MSATKLLFHIARQDGLEFVFNSGPALGYPMHTHVSVHTVSLVRGGSVRLTRPNGSRIFLPGELYHVAPHEPHSPEYGDGHDVLSVCVDKRHCEAAASDLLLTLFHGHAHELVRQQLITKADMHALALGIAGIRQMVPFPPHTSPSSVDLTDILPYRLPSILPDILTETLHGVASPYARIRRFKRRTGLTPHQYLVQERLRCAKKLLTTTTSIADAALLAGFCDQSHLNRWFRKCLGITPDEYRRACVFTS